MLPATGEVSHAEAPEALHQAEAAEVRVLPLVLLEVLGVAQPQLAHEVPVRGVVGGGWGEGVKGAARGLGEMRVRGGLVTVECMAGREGPTVAS
jgi:hypothetical protein